MLTQCMRTVEIRIPEEVLRQAQDLAIAENITAEQVLGRAVTEAIGAWVNQRVLEGRRRAAGRKRFLEMLQDMLDGEGREVT